MLLVLFYDLLDAFSAHIVNIIGTKICYGLINKHKSFSAIIQGYHETVLPGSYLAAASLEGFLALSER